MRLPRLTRRKLVIAGILVVMLAAVSVVVLVAQIGRIAPSDPVLHHGKKRDDAIEVILNGPFPLNERISLRACASELVVPMQCALSQSRWDAQILVVFSFIGDTNPQRRIDVEIVALDQNGTVIARRKRVHTDQRCAEPYVWGSLTYCQPLANIAQCRIERAELLKAITRIVVTFRPGLANAFEAN